MKINELLQDVFEKITYIDKKVENPFLNSNNGNPFSQFFHRTFVWIEDDTNN